MPNDDQKTPPHSIAEWVLALFDELHAPQVIEVALLPGDCGATVECQGAAGPPRQHTLQPLLVAGVLGKMKKMARLDMADRGHRQSGRVRLLNFHGSPSDFEITTERAGENETMTLRRL